VGHCPDKPEPSHNDIGPKPLFFLRALGRDWYLGDERTEAREDAETALTLLKNWLGAEA